MKSKLKTHKATAKRIRFTKGGKLLKRHGGQDHFNARDSGTITRKKRRDQNVSNCYAKTLMKATPNK